MDSFFRFLARRLTRSFFAVFLAGWVVCALLWAPRAYADDPPRGTALQQCQTYWASWVAQGHTCFDHTNSNGQGYFTGADYPPFFPYSAGAPSASVCSALPSVTISVGGAWSVGKSFPQHYTDPISGSTVICTMVATSVGPPTLNPYNGQWTSRVSFVPNPNPAGGSAAQDGTVSNADGSAAGPAIPNVTTPVPTASQPSPQVCGGGSCYDPTTDTYYATGSDGKQVGVPGSSARSSAGGCASSSAMTVCSGSPSPPLPSPPQSPITDPATQAQTIDKTVQQNPQTGGNQTVTTVVYSLPGNKTSSGQKAGDSGPAPATSTGNSSSASGGGDCNSPPACSGDAVNCAILREQWYTMCSAKAGTDQIHKDLAGDGTQSPPTGGTHTGADVNGSTVDTGDTSGLNSTGLGWGTSCPFNDFTVTIGNTTANISFQPVCDYGAYMRGFVLLLAAITSAGILGGFKAAPFGGGGGS